MRPASRWDETSTPIAVGNRPGLIGSLLVGVASAKALAWALGKPLIGVDHVRAHLYAARLKHMNILQNVHMSDAPSDDPGRPYPALGLVVSGGHTSLYAIDDPMHMSLLGRTIDDAVGEAYDKVAAILQLGFPGGPIVDQRAQRGDARAVDLPRTMLERDSLDFSFSGLKTAVLYHVRGKPTGRGGAATFARDATDLTDQQIDDTCAAFQAAAVDVLIAKIERAVMQMTGEGNRPAGLIIGGGVSANSLLRARITELGAALDLPVHIPAMPYCLDNAAMIAGLGHHYLVNQHVDDLTLTAATNSTAGIVEG
jgi:N6-L-threonylcarbamoyladenine synthase